MRSILVAFFSLFSGNAAEDPELRMTVPQIIRKWGYPAEIHEVTTTDGYILEMHRIPYGTDGKGNSSRPVVFLQHGLLAASSSWVTNLPHLSLGFLLADAGFDVWMGNSRGNTYSRRHVTLDSYDKQFWHFSWDHMVKYDLDASIDYVLAKTGQESLFYVAHSQGTLIMFSKLSMDPAFGKKIRQFHALAPVATIKHIKGFIKMLSYLPLDLVFAMIGGGELLLNNDGIFANLVKLPCTNPITVEICSNFLFSATGYSSNQLNVSRIPVYLADYPAGTSTQNILHWAQMARSGDHRMFNYFLPYFNNLHYGQDSAPFYDVSKVDVPTYLYSSPSDWLASEGDVENYLIPRLSNKTLKRHLQLDNFNHLDFIWGNLAAQEVYQPIIRSLLQYDTQPLTAESSSGTN